MVDLFSVLLIFLLLTASFRPSEVKPITAPNSVSEKQAPDNDIMTILISRDYELKAGSKDTIWSDRVFFNIDNGKDTTTHFRATLLQKMGEQYKIDFTPQELKKFEKMAAFGMPMKDMKKFINAQDTKERDAFQTGVPMDSTDNQLAWWVRQARYTNPEAEVAIKADAETPYMAVKKVMDLLQENKVNKFNLVTNLMKDEVTIKDLPK